MTLPFGNTPLGGLQAFYTALVCGFFLIIDLWLAAGQLGMSSTRLNRSMGLPLLEIGRFLGELGLGICFVAGCILIGSAGLAGSRWIFRRFTKTLLFRVDPMASPKDESTLISKLYPISRSSVYRVSERVSSALEYGDLEMSRQQKAVKNALLSLSLGNAEILSGSESFSKAYQRRVGTAEFVLCLALGLPVFMVLAAVSMVEKPSSSVWIVIILGLLLGAFMVSAAWRSWASACDELVDAAARHSKEGYGPYAIAARDMAAEEQARTWLTLIMSS